MSQEDYQAAWIAASKLTPTTSSNLGSQVSARDLTCQQQQQAQSLQHQRAEKARKTKVRARTRQQSGENLSPIRSRQQHLQMLSNVQQSQQRHHRSTTAINGFRMDPAENSHQFSTNSGLEKQQNNGESIDLANSSLQQRAFSLTSSSSTSGSSIGNGNNTGTVMSFSPHQRLSGQYSSSQAHLQSLTNESADDGISCSNSSSSIMRRKTPEQLFHYRSQQLSLSPQATIANGITKPMLTSMPLNEQQPSSSSSLSLMSSPLHHQVRCVAPISSSQVHPATTSGGFMKHQPSGNQHLLPPPYSASVASAAIQPQQQQQQQQHVICNQPPPVQAQPYSSSDNQQQHTPHAQLSGVNSSSNSARIASQFPNQNNNNSTSVSNQQAAGNFSSSMPLGQHQFLPPVYLTAAAAAHNAPIASALPDRSNCLQQPSHHNNNNNSANQQQQVGAATIVGASKSKSCLTCADISIKWYIVVIALLGLICALIGTIVGAVHSAGRDYISLALLLIGVGLVLIAISWIALRITVKTYRSSGRRSRNLLGNQQHLHQYQQHSHQQVHLGQQQHRTFHQHHLSSSAAQQPPILNPPILRPAQLSRLLSGIGSSSRMVPSSMANERLYMVAAAASSAMSRSAQLNPQQPGELSHPTGAMNGNSSGFLSGIKRRLPRCWARLIPCSSGSQEGAARSGRPINPGIPTPLPNLLNLGLDGSGSALAALLHHYQQQAAAGLIPPPFLFGLNPRSAHLLAGLATPDGLPIRPPPPSYSASMQDYRFRQLIQEQAQQQQQQPVSASDPRPGPSFSASSASPAQQTREFSRIQVNSDESVNERLSCEESSQQVVANSPAKQDSVRVTNDIYVSAQEQDSPLNAQETVESQQQQQQPGSQVKILGYL